MNKKVFLLVLISFFPLLYALDAQLNGPVGVIPDAILGDENHSTALRDTESASSGSIEVEQTVAESRGTENSAGTFHGGGEGQMAQFSSASPVSTTASALFASVYTSASYSQHVMCKNWTIGIPLRGIPINATTIFRPSDSKVYLLTTFVIKDQVEFRWYYRNDSSKTWVFAFYHNALNDTSPVPPLHFRGTYREYIYGAWLAPAEGYSWLYPTAYKVDVFLDGSFAFSEFFEVTNGGLNSPRMSEGIDDNGRPVNVKSRFTIGNDTKAYHSLRFDKIAFFNGELGSSHNFTTVWIQPNGITYKTYSGSFSDYKDTNVNWNYWEYNYIPDDYISINSSTPVGNWKVKVYLDRYFNNTWMPYGPVATTPFIVGNETVADWTFMVYLDADIDIETAGIVIFEKMASVGSTAQVNVVVQMDRIPGYNSSYGDWNDTKRFYVTKGMAPTPENANMSLGEVDMGDPKTLKDFINWTISNYTANYYFLVIWDHGAGFVGIAQDFTSNYDFLNLTEVSRALSGLPVIIDVVFSDACSMNMIEIAYQIKDYVNLLVGPEGLGYSPAPYNDYLFSLTTNPTMLPSDFAKEVVTIYINWAKTLPSLPPPNGIQNATMSTLDETKIVSLMAAMDNFALTLKEKETLYYEQINLARNQTEGFIGPLSQSGYIIDLYHFAQLTLYISDGELRNTAQQVMTKLESIIIAEDSKNHLNSYGLSIFFPEKESKYNEFKNWYEATAFAKNTPWDEFVKYHLQLKTSGCKLTIQTPYKGIQVGFDGESYTTDSQGKLRVFVLPDSYNVSVPELVSIGPCSRGNFTRWNDSETETSPSRTITSVTGLITYTANYETQYKVTFSQSGIGTDFAENIVTIDGTEYNASSLPYFWWLADSTHTFSFKSPLVVTLNAKRYVWNSTISLGLTSQQTDLITVSTFGTVTANYKTQFYLTLTTSPSGVTTPSSPGWYYNGTQASLSTREFVDITPTASRYRFNGWTTNDITKIADPDLPSTTVLMDEAKTVTANYLTQYYLTVVSPYGSLSPSSGWFDSGTSITASVTSPWYLGEISTRYVCNGWIGTGSVSPSGTNTSVTFTINEPSSITWSWRTQYLLTVRTDPAGLSPQPNVSQPGPWYDNGTQVTLTAQEISGRVFDHWTVNGANWDIGIKSITVVVDEPVDATAYYVYARTWWEILLRAETLQVILGFVGTVLTVGLLGGAWFRTRRRKSVVKTWLNEIDDAYSRLKTNPQMCQEELSRLRNTILEGVTDGKITQENYDIIDKKIDKYMEELRKK